MGKEAVQTPKARLLLKSPLNLIISPYNILVGEYLLIFSERSPTFSEQISESRYL
jgi:hypothetical protein